MFAWWSFTRWFMLLMVLIHQKELIRGPSCDRCRVWPKPTRYPSHHQASLSPWHGYCPPPNTGLYALLMKALHDAHSTVSHFPVGLEHLDNTIETDRLSLVLLECVGGTKIGCWLFTVSMHCSSPHRDKRAAMICRSGTPAEIIK